MSMRINIKKYAPLTVRYGISIVFILFGISQIRDPISWTGYLPSLISSFPISPENFIVINGISEIVLGILLAIGLFTRTVSALLSLHLAGIIISLGYNEIAIRDFGLLMGTLSIFLNGKDDWCLDNKLQS
jgi:uncharacterized membrane protein YphA (DoxX/SURF4 family)